MKSSIEKLNKRGYVDGSAFHIEEYISPETIRKMLESAKATERTKAALIIHNKKLKDFIPDLIKRLSSEKKLYCRIEICNALVSFGEKSIQPLIMHLGCIGNNQHRKLPEKPFKKDSYPLPRDIAARCLVRMGPEVISALVQQINSGVLDRIQMCEAVDVIGHISYNYYISDACDTMLRLFDEYRQDSLVTWKIVRSFSAFNCHDVRQLLKKVISNHNEKAIVFEAQRSLKLLDAR